jgi:putative colanic acid biosysnthesis UDP-glucose lipid carrier transferase
MLLARVQKVARRAVGTVMREHVKPDGARATSVDPRAQSTSQRSGGARFAASHPAADDMNGRIEILHLPAPVRFGGKPPVGGLSKRVFDLAAAAAALVLFAPLLLLVFLIVRLDSPGPAIFKQDRGGFGGKRFRIWKFRTMTVMENCGVVQARAGDARLTRIGGFLRRSSLDELPQLINVLLGDMSIVGPRPHAVEHDSKFEKVDPRYPLRFSARPGVTGLAQVSGCRGPTETEEKIIMRSGYDVEYVQAWSWRRELEIIGRTVKVLLKADPGAL